MSLFFNPCSALLETCASHPSLTMKHFNDRPNASLGVEGIDIILVEVTSHVCALLSWLVHTHAPEWVTAGLWRLVQAEDPIQEVEEGKDSRNVVENERKDQTLN